MEFRLKLYPKDFSAVRKFYADILQFPITTEWNNGENDRGVMFDVSGTTLELLSPKSGYEQIRGASIALEVADLMEMWEKLNDKTNVVFDPRHNYWGDSSFQIQDPEGFKITFFEKDM